LYRAVTAAAAVGGTDCIAIQCTHGQEILLLLLLVSPVQPQGRQRRQRWELLLPLTRFLQVPQRPPLLLLLLLLLWWQRPLLLLLWHEPLLLLWHGPLLLLLRVCGCCAAPEQPQCCLC
jgi:hypothetical protein